jgi:hypothetical protein
MKSDIEDISPALIEAAKNWLAMDGLWFQAVELAYGMDAALALDREVWKQFAVIEALRIKERLAIPERGGLDALEIAFKNRLVSLLNKLEIRRPDKNTLVVTTTTCRVQATRKRKRMPEFPCMTVGQIEFPVFARTIDARTSAEARPARLKHCRVRFVAEIHA